MKIKVLFVLLILFNSASLFGQNQFPINGATVLDNKIGFKSGLNDGRYRGVWFWSKDDSNHVIYSASPTGVSPGNNSPATGLLSTNSGHRLRFRTSTSQGFLFENKDEVALIDIDANNGNLKSIGSGSFKTLSINGFGFFDDGQTIDIHLSTPGGKNGIVMSANEYGNYSRFNMANFDNPIDNLRFMQFRFNADTYGLAIQKGGNVGIGTNAPRTALDVIAKGGSDLDWGASTGIYLGGDGTVSGKNWSAIRFDGSDSDAIIRLAESEQGRGLQIGLNETKGSSLKNVMAVKGDGKVGIGSNAPRASLEVVAKEHNYLGWGSSTGLFISGEGTVGGKNWSAMRFEGTDGDGIIRLAESEQGRGFQFGVNDTKNNNLSIAMTIKGNGSVGIGTNDPGNAKLAVEGIIAAPEILVEVNPGQGPDYVFEPDYDLMSLKETEAYIQANKHLPEIPPAKEMESVGLELGEMNLKLLQKIEELTLHQIALLKRLEEAENRIKELEQDH